MEEQVMNMKSELIIPDLLKWKIVLGAYSTTAGRIDCFEDSLRDLRKFVLYAMNNLMEVYGKEKYSPSSVDSACHASFYFFSMCTRLAAAVEDIQSNVDSRLQAKVHTDLDNLYSMITARKALALKNKHLPMPPDFQYSRTKITNSYSSMFSVYLLYNEKVREFAPDDILHHLFSIYFDLFSIREVRRVKDFALRELKENSFNNNKESSILHLILSDLVKQNYNPDDLFLFLTEYIYRSYDDIQVIMKEKNGLVSEQDLETLLFSMTMLALLLSLTSGVDSSCTGRSWQTRINFEIILRRALGVIYSNENNGYALFGNKKIIARGILEKHGNTFLSSLISDARDPTYTLSFDLLNEEPFLKKYNRRYETIPVIDMDCYADYRFSDDDSDGFGESIEGEITGENVNINNHVKVDDEGDMAGDEEDSDGFGESFEEIADL